MKTQREREEERERNKKGLSLSVDPNEAFPQNGFLKFQFKFCDFS